MKVSRLISAVSAAALVPFFFVGCASNDAANMDSADKGGSARADYPDWFFEDGGVFKDEGGQVIYAMGLSRQGPNLQTTRDIAKQAARSEIARILGSHLQGMISTYTQRASDFYDPDTFSDTENFENVTRNLSEAFVSGSYQIDSFFADADKSFCVLMRLDLRQADIIKDAQKSMRESYATKMQDQQTQALANMDDAFAVQDARINAVPSGFPQD